jgi:hypothetical protein
MPDDAEPALEDSGRGYELLGMLDDQLISVRLALTQGAQHRRWDPPNQVADVA